MSELVQYDAQPRSLVSWAQEADAAYVLAERMVGTAFCPAQFKGKPAEAAAAVLAGAEVGLSPLAALRSFDIIQGVAAPRALTLRAIAQAHGAQFQTTEETERKVVMRARRAGGEWETVTWTIERAMKLGLTGKDNWKKQPQAMLVARATAELARRVAADAILGLGYAVEEVDDDSPRGTASRTVARKSSPGRAALPSGPTAPDDDPWSRDAQVTSTSTLRRVEDVELPNDEPVAEAKPSFPEREQDDGGVTPTGDRPGYITKAQLRMLHALLNQAGMGEDRDRALAFYAEHGGTGRKVESSKDLTRVEATRVLDALVARTDEPDADNGDGEHDESLFGEQ